MLENCGRSRPLEPRSEQHFPWKPGILQAPSVISPCAYRLLPHQRRFNLHYSTCMPAISMVIIFRLLLSTPLTHSWLLWIMFKRWKQYNIVVYEHEYTWIDFLCLTMATISNKEFLAYEPSAGSSDSSPHSWLPEGCAAVTALMRESSERNPKKGCSTWEPFG